MSFDNKKTEDEWFVRNEAELLKSLKRERERREKELAEALEKEEAVKQKDLHWMKCPKCGSDLVEKEHDELRIDECTLCGGIFLDRGEMEALMMKKDRPNILPRVLGLFGKFK